MSRTVGADAQIAGATTTKSSVSSSIMFEDMLAYGVKTHLDESFSRRQAAELDDDARLFYLRMASDIAIVAASVDRQPHRGRIAPTLHQALVATAATRAASWRQLYHEIFALVAVSCAEAPGDELLGSRGRLCQFLAENADLADPLASEKVEPAQLGHVLEA